MDDANGWPSSLMAGKVKSWDAEVLRVSKVYADKIYANTIEAVDIVADEIRGDVASFKSTVTQTLDAQDAKINNLVAKAITTDNLKSQNIDAGQITTGTISADRINTSAITTNVISALGASQITRLDVRSLSVGAISVDNSPGKTREINYVKTSGGYGTLEFDHGILVGYS